MTDLEIILFAIGCTITGAALACIIRKLLFEKNNVPVKQLTEVNEKYQEVLTQKAVLQEKNNSLAEEKESYKIKLTQIESQYSELIQDHAKKSALNVSLIDDKDTLSKELSLVRTNLENKTEELGKSLVHIADKDAKLQYQQEQQAVQKTELANMGEKLKKDFQILASTILDEKTQKFTQLNSDNLKTILDPLKKDLGEFKSKVEETYDKESKERFSLGEKIKDLVELNHKISDEAHNLTKALKGESKKQGDWGEMILESVLENSGLVKDREYFVQAFIRDDAGNVIKNDEGLGMKPDVLVYYPDKRCLVIDSKVSLNAYERFANADDKETQEQELNNHIISIRSHIDGLSSKNYQNYIDSLDWVVMFVPIEPAYLVALRKDSDLWYYAYRKKIIMVCPSNLMAVLKITSDLWKREYQSQNALEIAKRGGQLYDKFVGFVLTMQDLGVTITKAQNTYDRAFGQLKTGSGNLVRQAELMRKLEIKASKKLPEQLVNEAIDDDLPLIEAGGIGKVDDEE
jgi:DNA recombination protein RmuC